MPDWTKSMGRTYEFYRVDADSWADVEKLTTVTSCTITRDADTDTLETCKIEYDGDFSECYIRVYLVTSQDGAEERFCLGTFLVQTPTTEYDGKISVVSADGYSPLIELKEKLPPIGYYLPINSNIMDYVCNLTSTYARSPIIDASNSATAYKNFAADTDETWLEYLTELLAQASLQFGLDDRGRIIFNPIQKLNSMRQVWTYTTDNSSIMMPSIKIDGDIYGIPNVVEVLYSAEDQCYYSKVRNKNVNSPVSVQNRGREVHYRTTKVDLAGTITQSMVDSYAKSILEEKSLLQYSITYQHGYCPVRVGDCVMLHYPDAGLNYVRAKVVSQQISCDDSCLVEETAVYEKSLL